MFKFTSLAIGLLTTISLVPAAQALPYSGNNSGYRNDIRPQVVVSVNPQIRQEPAQHQRWEANRRRELELAREREARARWEAQHRRYRQYDKHHNNSYGEYRDDRNQYRRDR